MLKYTILVLTLSIGLITTSNAQNEFDIRPVTEYISQGEKPGFEVIIPDGIAEDVHDNWKRYLRKQANTRAKSSRNSVEYFADDAKIPSVSENTVDIYSIASNVNEGTKFMVFVNLGGAYVSESAYPEEYSAFILFMSDFLREEQQRILERLISKEEDKLENLQDNLNDLVNDMDSNREEISELKAKIAELDANNEELISKQAKHREQIATQKEIIQVLRSKAKQ